MATLKEIAALVASDTETDQPRAYAAARAALDRTPTPAAGTTWNVNDIPDDVAETVRERATRAISESKVNGGLDGLLEQIAAYRREHEQALERAEQILEQRDAAIWAARQAGATVAELCEQTGLSRQRLQKILAAQRV